MEHPFKVGETYENRFGAYTVLDITPPKMKVQYDNGDIDAVTIAIQARIWRRKQDERAAARRRRRKQTRSRRPTNAFAGLAETDFKDNVAGTSYRSRKSLAGLIARRLSEAMNVDFLSTAIPRQPRFFIGPPILSFRNQEERVKLPKFEVRLDSERLLYSFYIEKRNKEMDDDWYWPNFLNLLSDPAVEDQISAATAEHDLFWLLRLEDGLDDSGEPLSACHIPVRAFGPGQPFTSYSAFVEHLHNLPTRQWCNLHIAGEMPKDKAIALGVKISDPITQTFKSLTPIFQHLLT